MALHVELEILSCLTGENTLRWLPLDGLDGTRKDRAAEVKRLISRFQRICESLQTREAQATFDRLSRPGHHQPYADVQGIRIRINGEELAAFTLEAACSLDLRHGAPPP